MLDRSAHSRILSMAVFGLLVCIAAAVMVPGLHGNFLFDDFPNIVENTSIQLTTLTFDSLHASLAGPAAGPLGRPVSVLSFSLTHYFFGLDPFAFKAINLAIHAINALLVAWLAALILRSAVESRLSETGIRYLSRWTALAWLVHPINIVPVMLVVQRMTLLSGMFMLLALIAHMKAVALPSQRTSKWIWLAAGWLVFWPLSVYSKESGLLFPLYVLAISFTALSPNREATNRAATRSTSWAILISLLVALTVTLVMVSFIGWGWLDSAYLMRPFTLTERLMTEARVLWFYAAQILVPNYGAFGLYLDDFPISRGLLNPVSTLPAIVGLAAVALAVFHFRRRYAIVCLGIAWFLLGHTLESTVLPLEIAHEHRNYLPAFGLILGAGYAAVVLLGKAKLDHRFLTIACIAMFSIAVLATLTWLRANQLGAPLHGPQIEAAMHPDSARANHAAALALIGAGYGDAGDLIGAHQVRYHLERVDAIDGASKSGAFGLIFWACASGRPVEREWIDRFAKRLEHAPFALRDSELPDRILKPLLGMHACLARADALRLFVAGANNGTIAKSLKARFLEAAADYELLVSGDPRSSRDYLAKALAATPEDRALKRKFDSFTEGLGPYHPGATH